MARRSVRALRLFVLPALLVTLGGCAYFNTFYYAKKYYNQAERQQEEARKNAIARGGTTATAGTVAGAQVRGSDLYNKAIEKCEKLIREHSDSGWVDDAYLLMAKAHYGKGDYVAARRELERLQLKFPDSELVPEAMFWNGRTEYADENYPAAQRAWTTLLEQHPKYDGREDVEFFLAESLRQERRFEEAAGAYEAFVARYPKGDRSIDARFSLGRMRLENKQYEEAREVFEDVARRASQDAVRREARLLLGESLELAERREEALEVYTELAFDLDPQYLSGRMTPEEREEILAKEREALAAAREDSLFNARFTDPNSPDYRGAQQNPDGTQLNPDGTPVIPGQTDPGGQTNPGQQVDAFGNPVNPNQQVDAFGNPVTPNQQVDAFGNPVSPNQQLDAFGNPVNSTAGNANQSAQARAQANRSTQLGQQPSKARLRMDDPAYRELGTALLREGRVLAALGRPWEAVFAYEQVLAEYPRSEYGAEAQYRIGYTQEVYLEDYDAAIEAYRLVQGQGRSSFIEDAERRIKSLETAKRMAASAAGGEGGETGDGGQAAAADARFLRAELYLYQQEKPERALEEYASIQTEMPGTEFAAKAALAEAYVRFSVLADTARGRAKYADVMRAYGDTEYGHQARRILRGPEREPKDEDFMGPTLDDLLTEVNMASVAARDSALYASLHPEPAAPAAGEPGDSTTALSGSATIPPGGAPPTPNIPGAGAPPTGGTSATGDPPVSPVLGEGVAIVDSTGAGNPAAPKPTYVLPSDPLAPVAEGPSPILTETQRAERRAAPPAAAPPTLSAGDSTGALSPADSLSTAPLEGARGLADIKKRAKALTPDQVRAMVDSLATVGDSLAAEEDREAAPGDSMAVPDSTASDRRGDGGNSSAAPPDSTGGDRE